MTIFGITAENLNVLISLSSLIIVTIGIFIAIKNIKIIAKTQKLEVINSFLDELRENESAREFLFKEYKFVTLDKMDRKSICEVEKVINSLNRICLLLDNKLINAEIILGLCHTMIIRCEYKLRDYIKDKEKAIGGRYGRRIIRLTKKAKNFQDSYKNHRSNPVKIHKIGTNPIIVYKTIIGNSFKEKLSNHLVWFWRRLWKIY